MQIDNNNNIYSLHIHIYVELYLINDGYLHTKR